MRARLRFDGGPYRPRYFTISDKIDQGEWPRAQQLAFSLGEAQADTKALDLSRICAGMCMLMLGRVTRPRTGDALDLSERHVAAAIDDMMYVALPAREVGVLVASLSDPEVATRHLPVTAQAQGAAVTRSLLLPGMVEQVERVHKKPLEGVDLRFSKRSPLTVLLIAIAPLVPSALAGFLAAYMKLSKHTRELRKMDTENEFEQLKLRALRLKVRSLEEASMLDNLERQLRLTHAILTEREGEIAPIREAFLSDGPLIDASVSVEFMEHPKLKS